MATNDHLCFWVSAMILSVQRTLQDRKAQPQPTMHSYHFRSSNESLYQSHHGLVVDLSSDQPGLQWEYRIEPWSSTWEVNALRITPLSRKKITGHGIR